MNAVSTWGLCTAGCGCPRCKRKRELDRRRVQQGAVQIAELDAKS